MCKNNTTRRGHYNGLSVAVATVVGFLPRSFIRRLYLVFKNVSGNVGLGLRYACISNLARRCGTNVAIFPNVYLYGIDRISMGNNISVHQMCYINASGGLTIGDNVSIAHGCSIISFNHTYNDIDIPIKYNPLDFQPIVIEDDVWIGCGCRILAGVKIGCHSIVAAGSVVTKDVPPNSVVAGVPAKVIKTLTATTDDKPIRGGG